MSNLFSNHKIRSSSATPLFLTNRQRMSVWKIKEYRRKLSWSSYKWFWTKLVASDPSSRVRRTRVSYRNLSVFVVFFFSHNWWWNQIIIMRFWKNGTFYPQINFKQITNDFYTFKYENKNLLLETIFMVLSLQNSPTILCLPKCQIGSLLLLTHSSIYIHTRSKSLCGLPLFFLIDSYP